MFMLLAKIMLSQYKKNTFEWLLMNIFAPINSYNILLINYLVFGLSSWPDGHHIVILLSAVHCVIKSVNVLSFHSQL